MKDKVRKVTQKSYVRWQTYDEVTRNIEGQGEETMKE